MITYGLVSAGTVNSVSFSRFVSDNNPDISSLRSIFNSSVPKYLSFATRSSILFIIFKVVFTPTSEATKTSSKLSKTSASTVDFPATAFDSLSKKLVFVFSKPLSKVSFFCLENIFFKKLIFLFSAF